MQQDNANPRDLSAPAIILVDDEGDILLGSTVMLRQAGLANIHPLSDSRLLLPLLARQETGVIVLDLQMPHLSGEELLQQLTSTYPQVPVVIMTGANELETAVACMKAGAFDYLVKPIESSRFIATVRKALEMSALRREIDSLKEHLLVGAEPDERVSSTIRSCNAAMKAIQKYLTVIAATDQPVLITGETGVGKELVARALHELSGRKGPFVAVNSAGLDELMFSDTLFGHRKGAFTGADQARDGMIARAAGGTLFLDEIGDMQPTSQVKLLRLLQDGEYYPLGSDHPTRNRAVIVVATNTDLAELISAGAFRRDLYYRLCAHKVRIPPLRERFDDIPLLLDTFLAEAAKTLHKKKPSIPRELVPFLCTYHFPGNIRELRGMVFDAVTRHQGGILAMTTFREAMCASPPVGDPGVPRHEDQWLDLSAGFPTLKEMEQSLIAAALKRSAGNQRSAASLLGISRQALNQRLGRK